MATIVHFEIPANDINRAQQFYSYVFGWKIEKDPQADYWTINTTDEQGESALAGGMYKRQDPQQPILDSIEDTSGKVQKLGGKVLVPKTAVPQYGYFAVCLDTEDNAFALWQTDKSAK
jgi:predicted enzyme related to lactoylglutathione lyase